jgi:site-specific DNA-methyltransferase (adenine-specific)
MIAWVYGSGFPKSLDVSKAIDKAAGAEREVVGFQKRGNSVNTDFMSGGNNITAPATDAARQWQGWGTALKPALEPITLARKPLEGTVAENVLKWHTGAVNVDGCRVESEKLTGWGGKAAGGMTWTGENCGLAKSGEARPVEGRWPANLIHDGSEEVTELLNDAARFFYCAKASKKDRDEGLEGFALHAPDHGKGNAAGGLQVSNSKHLRANIHPTVKPTDLMRYLCRLVTCPGGVILDPFTGSGSTGKAAVLEGYRFIGIEREAEYVQIARARISAVQQEKPEPDLLLI